MWGWGGGGCLWRGNVVQEIKTFNKSYLVFGNGLLNLGDAFGYFLGCVVAGERFFGLFFDVGDFAGAFVGFVEGCYRCFSYRIFCCITLVEELEKLLNTKFNGKYVNVKPFIDSLLKEKELSSQVKINLQKTLEKITDSISLEALLARLKEFDTMVKAALQYQQEAAQLQVEIAALSATAPGRQEIVDAHKINVGLCDNTVIIMQVLLTKTFAIMELVKNINTCLAKPTFTAGIIATKKNRRIRRRFCFLWCSRRSPLSRG